MGQREVPEDGRILGTFTLLTSPVEVYFIATESLAEELETPRSHVVFSAKATGFSPHSDSGGGPLPCPWDVVWICSPTAFTVPGLVNSRAPNPPGISLGWWMVVRDRDPSRRR